MADTNKTIEKLDAILEALYWLGLSEAVGGECCPDSMDNIRGRIMLGEARDNLIKAREFFDRHRQTMRQSVQLQTNAPPSS